MLFGQAAPEALADFALKFLRCVRARLGAAPFMLCVCCCRALQAQLRARARTEAPAGVGGIPASARKGAQQRES